MSDEIPLSANSLGAALRDIRSQCGPEPPEPPEIDWDGVSPIDGEEVTSGVDFLNVSYVFTASRVYRVRQKGIADH